MQACAGNEMYNVAVVVLEHVGWGSLLLEPQKDAGLPVIVECAVGLVVPVVEPVD